MRFVSLTLSAFLVTSSAFAQAGSSGPATTFAAPLGSQSCPIDLYAQRQSGLQASRIDDAPPHNLEGKVEILFRQLDAPAIVQVIGVAHGPSLGGHLDPASTAHPGDITEVFRFQRPLNADSLQRAELRTHTMSNSRWLELTRIDFADGSHWHASPGSHCRATPNPFVLTSLAR